MSRFLEQLEAQLDKAARRQAAAAGSGGEQPPSRRHWLRSGTRVIPVALAIGVTAAVVVAVGLTLHTRQRSPAATSASHAAAAASHARRSGTTGLTSVSVAGSGMPIIGHLSPQQQHETTYVFAVEEAAMKTPACRSPAIPRATVSDASPSPALLSELGVLRRAATPADKLTLPMGSGQVYPVNAQTVYVRDIRRARVRDGVSYYLIPVGHIVEPVALSARCIAKQKALLRRDLPRLPASERSSTVALQTKMIAGLQGSTGGPPQDGVCVWGATAAGGSGNCETVSQFTAGVAVEENGSTMIGVVPDGVASVAFHYPAGHGVPAVTVTANVVGNVYAASVGRLLPSGAFPPQVSWRSANGTVIRTISLPSGGETTTAPGSEGSGP